MASIAQALSAIAAMPDQKAKTDGYRSLLAGLLAKESVEECNAFVDHMLSDDVPLVISRQLLTAFASEVPKLPAEVHQPVATHTLERLQPRVVSFEEAVTSLREALAELLVRQERWAHAAQVLAGIDLESGSRGPAEKLGKQLRIAMLYLEDDDPVSAEAYIKKAASLLSGGPSGGGTGRFEPALELQYKVCYARILDAKRRFLEAAHRYYELSCTTTAMTSLGGGGSGSAGQAAAAGGEAGGKGGIVSVEDSLTALRNAITCTILAPAGPQRSRLLATLCKDERSAVQPVFPFLEKVYRERILAPGEVASFAAGLSPHQLALLPGGGTVLDRAVMQHNLLAASRLYDNITVSGLGDLLGVDPGRAEAVAADMVADGRLPPGSVIDQVDGLIHFGGGGGGGGGDTSGLAQWDEQIRGLCTAVNDVVDYMTKAGLSVSAVVTDVT